MAILTVSSESGSRGREIGRAVSESLGYAFVNKEKILADVRSAGQEWEEWARDYDGRCPTTWERYDWSFQGFAALIRNCILSYAARDRVVIMGRGGNFLLAGIPHALRVRVTAPLEVRVAEIAKRESISDKAARWLIDKTHHERACFIYSLYRTQWDDLGAYDLIVSTADTPVEDAVKLVIDRVAERDAAKTEGARKDLEMRALAARLKAALVTTPGLFLPTLEVEYERGHLVLRAIVHNRKEQALVEETVRNLAGDVPLTLDLHRRL
jgi:cytidylate kinase